MPRTVEFRTYQLHPGAEARFDKLVQRRSVPLLRQVGMQVVWAGPSMQDPQAYMLVRAYADEAELLSSQAHFYASPAWREGPREEVLACIASSTSVVLKLPQAALQAWLPNPSH
jgi:hypothetical protein